MAGAYVPETRFGEWFQRTDIWRRYVVQEAIAELTSLLPAPSPSFRTILDAGCGEGVAFDILARKFPLAAITGVDINPDAVGAARHAAAVQAGRIQVHLADSGRLPLDSGSVDLVLCHQLLHHCSDPDSVLAELRRVLAPGGWLLIAESCRAFLEWWPVRLLFRHPRRDQHTADGYVALVAEAGFVVDPNRFLTPAPWWSRPDLGLRARMGGDAVVRNPTQVRIAAKKGPASPPPATAASHPPRADG